jgi:hypothetical protein
MDLGQRTELYMDAAFEEAYGEHLRYRRGEAVPDHFCASWWDGFEEFEAQSKQGPSNAGNEHTVAE